MKSIKLSRKSNDNILLVGFPSNGLVGTFTISYFIHYLKMKQVGEIENLGTPSDVVCMCPYA